jgi:hypothetical protein
MCSRPWKQYRTCMRSYSMIRRDVEQRARMSRPRGCASSVREPGRRSGRMEILSVLNLLDMCSRVPILHLTMHVKYCSVQCSKYSTVHHHCVKGV